MLKKIETGHFTLGDKQREAFERSRKLINKNHPVRDEFKRMMEERLNQEKKNNG